ncbi:IpaD/SipD/SspD family type III secretion system needle tip protein [Erwinia sp. ErVv1]|uniref:IpaD/SipD/SspD family type III secretion system needle tip protein n=1 Tax=Erwinia sp. ErVv1 TaxID=1603299 RepID=UPI0008329CBB|nr:IpaD/SipD/SspD family type III secretion system needle tip protein [Erwinia sp. ErVv1]
MKIQSGFSYSAHATSEKSSDKINITSNKESEILLRDVPRTGTARTSLDKKNHQDLESIKASLALEKKQREVQITVLKALVKLMHSDISSPYSSDMLKIYQPLTTSTDALSFGQNLRKFDPVRSAPDETNDPLYRPDSLSSMVKAERPGPSSSWEICDSVADSIGAMGEDYLDVFQQAVEKNAEFYSDFSDFMSKLSQFIKADGDKTILKTAAFAAELDKLINKYKVPSSATTLYPVQSGNAVIGGDKEECEAWAKEMGLNSDKSVTRLADGSYIVHIDVLPLENIKKTLPGYSHSWEDMKCNSAQWAAWQSGFDMQKDSIQTAMQTLTQKYSNANSTFDNLVKVLSGTISSLLESDKSFFNI